jgi:hypothetical protein
MRRSKAGASLAQQALALDARFPGGTATFNRSRLLWAASLSPTADSRIYTVTISYRLGAHPEVRVTDPPLDTRLGESLPHIFRGGSLCLYREEDWSPRILLADSVVPWAAEWLLYYEIWLATGEWEGGGEWPPVDRSLSLPTHACRADSAPQAQE